MDIVTIIMASSIFVVGSIVGLIIEYHLQKKRCLECGKCHS